MDLTGLETVRYRTEDLGMVMRADHPLARNEPLSYTQNLDFDQISRHMESSIFSRSKAAARQAERSLRHRIHMPGFDAICPTVQAKGRH